MIHTEETQRLQLAIALGRIKNDSLKKVHKGPGHSQEKLDSIRGLVPLSYSKLDHRASCIQSKLRMSGFGDPCGGATGCTNFWRLGRNKLQATELI